MSDIESRYADLLLRRADVYAKSRNHPNYYGDADIDLLRGMIDDLQARLTVSAFTIDELKSALVIKIGRHPPGGPQDRQFEFHGFVTIGVMQEIWPALADYDRDFLQQTVVTAMDMLQSLEIIFRAWGELHPPKPICPDTGVPCVDATCAGKQLCRGAKNV